ncbi:cyclopropane-fatty-acyl-phospholipid synthase [Cupriavidus sp. SK-3]|uniref:SAM-dependent methyltransferase n=1 Tax=Cupriavidus sp. SK-3 TaxID=1470558 RepID=UPI0004496DF1|nr:cyclopropane-fatty-acyl-phospholipid synthase family protein [Cupriavidus sp. SK-3]KDP88104.1 cyclopropane-fatty-acyl-phospholipid synthase [Cupriavidus sp. SK-3]
MNDRARALEAIQFHYDVSNDFYSLWLDERMVYSCAMWDPERPDEGLAAAQRRKVDYHLDQVGVESANTILDVGCGWGAILQRGVERNANLAHAVGLTLSAAQHEHVTLVAAATPQISCRLENWLDHRPDSRYDGIVSIGAFEHFASPDDSDAQRLEKYRAFFAFCKAHLNKGGRLSMQTIAYLSMRRTDASKFMETEIFPNSDLPYLSEVVQACEGLLEVTSVRNDRLDYARTCGLWLQRLRQRRDEAEAVAGKDTVARFEKYLAMSSIGFHQGKLCLLRMTARNS